MCNLCHNNVYCGEFSFVIIFRETNPQQALPYIHYAHIFYIFDLKFIPNQAVCIMALGCQFFNSGGIGSTSLHVHVLHRGKFFTWCFCG